MFEELILKINVMFVLKHFGRPKVWVNKSEVFILKKKSYDTFLRKRCTSSCLDIIWKIVIELSDCLSIIDCIWLNYLTLEPILKILIDLSDCHSIIDCNWLNYLISECILKILMELSICQSIIDWNWLPFLKQH